MIEHYESAFYNGFDDNRITAIQFYSDNGNRQIILVATNQSTADSLKRELTSDRMARDTDVRSTPIITISYENKAKEHIVKITGDMKEAADFLFNNESRYFSQELKKLINDDPKIKDFIARKATPRYTSENVKFTKPPEKIETSKNPTTLMQKLMRMIHL